MPSKPWKLIAAFTFFSLPFIGLLTLIGLGWVPLVSYAGVIMLLCGGFTVAGISLLPPLNRRRGAGDGPNAAQWIFLLIGVGLWCAAPVVALLGTDERGSVVGSAGSVLPVWFLAAVTWGTAVLMLLALVRQRRRARGRS